jgi:hypothetical protein
VQLNDGRVFRQPGFQLRHQLLRQRLDVKPFAFREGSLHGHRRRLSTQVETRLTQRCQFGRPQSSVGSQLVWRAGVELRKWLRDDLSVALVFNYDRFASENALFEAERYVTGVVTTFEY